MQKGPSQTFPRKPTPDLNLRDLFCISAHSLEADPSEVPLVVDSILSTGSNDAASEWREAHQLQGFSSVSRLIQRDAHHVDHPAMHPDTATGVLMLHALVRVEGARALTRAELFVKLGFDTLEGTQNWVERVAAASGS